MLPEEHLANARQHIDQVLVHEELTDHEREWLEDSEQQLAAVEAILARQRDLADGAEVLTGP